VPRLAEELKMSRPFTMSEEEAMLAVLRTADVVQQRTAFVLREHDITSAQYNVLRILNGSPEGLCCREISERLIARDPDITRLLDRMESRDWIQRKRSESDRRVIVVCITPVGTKLIAEIRPSITAYLRRQFSAWEAKQIKQLIELLQKVRD
jgi:DNA-binding MarR family transcriptional regulator